MVKTPTSRSEAFCGRSRNAPALRSATTEKWSKETPAGRSRNATSAADVNPDYIPFDLVTPDQKRADVWIAELQSFVRDGNMPQLELMWLPMDHLDGRATGQMHAERLHGRQRSRARPHRAGALA